MAGVDNSQAEGLTWRRQAASRCWLLGERWPNWWGNTEFMSLTLLKKGRSCLPYDRTWGAGGGGEDEPPSWWQTLFATHFNLNHSRRDAGGHRYTQKHDVNKSNHSEMELKKTSLSHPRVPARLTMLPEPCKISKLNGRSSYRYFWAFYNISEKPNPVAFVLTE